MLACSSTISSRGQITHHSWFSSTVQKMNVISLTSPPPFSPEYIKLTRSMIALKEKYSFRELSTGVSSEGRGDRMGYLTSLRSEKFLPSFGRCSLSSLADSGFLTLFHGLMLPFLEISGYAPLTLNIFSYYYYFPLKNVNRFQPFLKQNCESATVHIDAFFVNYPE